MKKEFSILLFSLLLASCLGIIDTKNNKPVTKVDQTELTGIWQADKFSYEFTVNTIKNQRFNFTCFES